MKQDYLKLFQPHFFIRLRKENSIFLLTFMLCLLFSPTKGMAQVDPSNPLFETTNNSSYNTDQPYIRFTTSKKSGKWQFTLGIRKEDKATAWADLNGNGQYDTGEEKIAFFKLWKPAIEAQTITIYGKVNWVSCSQNGLTEIDLSHNKLITYIACDGNKLTKLDLSQNSLIDKLYCNGNNLSELKLSEQKQLKELYCFDNPSLKSLDLREHTHLEELFANRCSLTELLLSSHPSLTLLKADENQLSSINLSNTPALQKLWLASNQLTEVEVSSLSSLNELQVQFNKLNSLILPSTPTLTALSFAGNPISQIDLSKQTNLQSLDCSTTELKHLDLSSHSGLIQLYCYSNQLSLEEVDKILESLPIRTIQEEAFAMIVDSANPKEKNKASDKKVAIAKGKGWNIYDYKGGENYGCNPYEGVTNTLLVASTLPQILLEGRRLSIHGDYISVAVYNLKGELLSCTTPLSLEEGQYLVVVFHKKGMLTKALTITK